MSLDLLLYIGVMAGVTYLIRMLPFVLLRKKIKSRFIRSVLYYMPYAVLTAMTVPAVFTSAGTGTDAIIAAAAGIAISVLLALKRCSLITVAAAACLTVYAAGKLIQLL